jgi:hypothetical protein
MINMKFSFIALVSAMILITGCQPESGPETPLSIAEGDILPHIEELSSDAYFGRMPFGAGDKVTVQYLVDQCKEFGLEPGNNGSYTQSVPMVEITSSPVGGMTVKSPSGNLEYTVGKDYAAICPKTVDEVEISDAELVFCGDF